MDVPCINLSPLCMWTVLQNFKIKNLNELSSWGGQPDILKSWDFIPKGVFDTVGRGGVCFCFVLLHRDRKNPSCKYPVCSSGFSRDTAPKGCGDINERVAVSGTGSHGFGSREALVIDKLETQESQWKRQSKGRKSLTSQLRESGTKGEFLFAPPFVLFRPSMDCVRFTH